MPKRVKKKKKLSEEELMREIQINQILYDMLINPWGKIK
jgi:uncharacterized protein (TIGR02413 family)